MINNILFNNNSTNDNDQENEIESKLQSRQESFINDDNFNRYKENTMTKELSEGENKREIIFRQKRLEKVINAEQTQTLKSQLKIPLELFENCNKMEIQKSNFNEIIEAFSSQDVIKKYSGLVGIRKLLILNDAPLQELIDLDIITELISLLDSSFLEFQYESLRCLTNIISERTSQSSTFVQNGGIPKVIKLLDSYIEEIKNQAICLIGNLAGDSYKIRNLLIKTKTFDKLITIISCINNLQIIKQATRAINVFFIVKPTPTVDLAKKSLNAISRALIMIPNDIGFLSDASYILLFITQFYKEIINNLLDTNIIQNIIQMLTINSKLVQLNCLKIIGNIASGNANQTQKLLDLGIVDYLKKSILSNFREIRKVSVFTISNIAAGTQKQVETLIGKNILPILYKIIKIDQPDIKKDCIWAVCNLTTAENPIYIKKLLDQGILDIICECIKTEDGKNLVVCLEALRNLLSFGKKYYTNDKNINPIVVQIDKMGATDVLEKLQLHPMETIYQHTIEILDEFFETQNEE